MVRVASLAVLVGTSAFADVAAIAARMDALHLRRDEPAAQQETEQLIAQAAKESPDTYDIAWRASRFEVWIAETSTNDEKKKVAAKRAWDYGDKAMALKPDRAEGSYYAAAGVGLYGQAMGVMTAIKDGVAGKFNDRVDKAIKLDPQVGLGGPLIARGRYYYEVPFFMRDLKKSADFLQKAIAKHPENLRAHLYLAQTWLKDGNAKRAKAEIELIASGDESYDPPDARRVKELAKPVAKDVADALK